MRIRIAWVSLVALSGAFPAQGRQDEKIKVSFVDVELDALVKQVEKATKKSFLYQDQLLKGKRVTLQSETPISPDEFYLVFQSICLMHGLAHVPVKADNLTLVKIVQSTQAAKEPGAQPILARGEVLPKGDNLIYYLVSPKHISSAKATAVMTPALSSIGAVHPVPNSEVLLVMDAASSIVRIEKLLSMVDVPGEPVVVSPLVLAHAQASLARAQLTELFQAMDKVSSTEPGREKLVVLLDERLNTLHLVGLQRDVKRAETFLKEIDREVPQAKRLTGYFRLKNVPVSDVVDIVRQLLGLAVALREPEEEAKSSKKAGPLADRPTRELAGGPAMPPSVAGPAAPKEAVRTDAPGEARPHSPKPSVRVPSGGDTDIVALDGQNTLVVIGTQAVQDDVRKILENLDRRKGQVLIEVAIIQVTGDDSLDSGVEVLFEDTRKNGARVNGGTGFGQGTPSDTKGAGFPNVQNLSSFTGGAFRYLKPDDISVLIKLISTKSNVNILSQPLLLVNDNEQASFTTKVSEPTIATSQGTATTTTSFAGFAEAVTTLNITPQISPDGYLNLKITQSFEEFTGSGSSGVPPPKVSNNVSTMITVPDRFTAIMGGFTRDAVTDTRTGIPILMDIPLIGALAGQTSHRITKSRLYLFVRPKILMVEGFSDLKNASHEKVRDVRAFTQGSSMEGPVKDAFGTPGGPDVKEAPIPFDLPKETPK
jgi:general secretion pathway protein D